MTVTTDVVATIISHHADLQATLNARVESLLDATRAGSKVDGQIEELRHLLEHDIVPHARAEEDVLYAAATAPTLRPLVEGMLFEHETLRGLADDLGRATTAVDAAGVAAAIRAVFAGHVRRENELLLPALSEDPQVDLPALLPVMHKQFADYRGAPHRHLH